MYSEVINGLGFSQHTLEMMVLSAIGIIILGVILVLYWQQIIVGALALGCVVVLANHKSETPNTPVVVSTPVVAPVVEKKPEVVIEPKEEIINQVKPNEDFIADPKDSRKMFMEDCLNLADYTKSQCESLWDDRVQEERAILEETRLKRKNHGNYRKVGVASSREKV
jgi:hypothetical protein